MYDAYISQLRAFESQLDARVEHVSVRGSDAASFLFATNAGRAVEASMNGDAWWIEFWESDDEYGSPSKEITLPDDARVLQALLDWLVKAD